MRKHWAELSLPDGLHRGAFDNRDYLLTEEFRLHVRLLRDLVRIWRAHQDEISFDEAWRSWESEEFYLGPADAGGVDEMLAVRMRWFLASHLSHALKPFHLSVSARSEEVTLEERGRFRSEWDFSLFAAMCLQFANHIAEKATYHVCRNETCGHLFVRQRGRAVQGQYRTAGVVYCSPACSRTQAQRELRRRRKAQRDEATS